MGRTLTGVPALLLGLTLTVAGCSGDAETSPPPSPTSRATSAPTTPSSSPTPTPPVMPEAAKAHTKAGAKAFVRYLWALADSLGAAPDPAPMQALFDEGCTGCEGVLDLLARLQRHHGVLRGSDTELSNFAIANRTYGGEDLTEVAVDVISQPSVADYPGTASDVRYPGGKRRTMFLLSYDTGTWRVRTWQPV